MAVKLDMVNGLKTTERGLPCELPAISSASENV